MDVITINTKIPVDEKRQLILEMAIGNYFKRDLTNLEKFNLKIFNSNVDDLDFSLFINDKPITFKPEVMHRIGEPLTIYNIVAENFNPKDSMLFVKPEGKEEKVSERDGRTRQHSNN